MDIADVLTEFGSYYINQGQNLARLYQILYRDTITESILTTVMTTNTLWRAASSTISSLLQPYQKTWTPKGSVTFTPVDITLHKMKMDFQDTPDDLEASWLGFLAGEGLDRKQWPFVRWLVEQHLLPKIKEEYELYEIWDGIHKDPVAGNAGNVGEGMNGLRYAINYHINTSGRITPIVTGAWSTTPDTFVGEIEDFVDQINAKYRGMQMQAGINETLYRRFQRGYEKKYGTRLTQIGGGNANTANMVKFSNITLVALPSMGNSQKIWVTPKSNAVLCNKRTANMNRVQVENVDRTLKIYTDFSKGVGFIIPEIVFTNDLDLAASASAS